VRRTAVLLAAAIAGWGAIALGATGPAPSDFAPIGAVPDDTARYRLPFRLDMPRLLIQGVDGALSHFGTDRYAFDFAMPVGTEVLCARAGTVARVVDGFTEGGFEEKYRGEDNFVAVLHADGTFAVYAHLRKGIPVHVGQPVRPGDRIGWSGQTGYAAGPHLHFGVYLRIAADVDQSVPIRFGVRSPRGFVPQEGQFYGRRPRTNVTLRVSAGGKVLADGSPLHVVRNGKMPLHVALLSPGGGEQDVTHAAATHYYDPTAWSIRVDASGLATASPSADYARALQRMRPDLKRPGALSWGVLVISYDDTASGRRGFTSVPFVIDDAKP
jgi:murein DD-endopeptidase MepM/ murein hydrolase activator NlpD